MLNGEALADAVQEKPQEIPEETLPDQAGESQIPNGTNLLSIALACLHQLCPPNLDSSARPELQFLEQYAWPPEPQLSSHESLIELFHDYLNQPNAVDFPLLNLCHHYQVSPIEVIAIRLCIAVEENPVVGRALAYMQHPIGSMRPTLGLLDKAFRSLLDNGEGVWLAAAITSGNAVFNELLIVQNPQHPLPDQTLAVPLHIVKAINGIHPHIEGVDYSPFSAFECVTEKQKQLAKEHARSLLGTNSAALVIRSPFTDEKKQLAQCVALAANKSALFIQNEQQLPQGFGLYCETMQLIPTFCYNLSPAEKKSCPQLKGYRGPTIILVGLDGWVEHVNQSILEWIIETPTAEERTTLWANNLSCEGFADELGKRYIQSAGRIAQLSNVVLREANRNGGALTLDAVSKAASYANTNELDVLAQPVPHRITDEGLVLDLALMSQMQQFYLHCVERENLHEHLGISVKQRYHSGVKALMVGPSGTGKTLSASWLATKLGLPLYKVEIASIVSKYIGETEKNLAVLLEKAESSDVVLLFDEADSLFGKRTDVKDSTDRFANSQTNYLLQRIENYRGIVILTSNSRSRIDSAFMRRIDHVIEFTRPAAEERRKLWQVHLGEGHQLQTKELNKIATKCDFGGGQIRNAVLSAAVLAKHRGQSIEYQDLVQGIACEYRKLGKQLPAGLIIKE